MSVKVRVLAMMALCMAMVAQADGWKYKWPVLCPDVLERTHEATTCVPLDANLAVSVACADGAQESAWAAGKLKAWFGCAAAVRDVSFAGDLPAGDEAYAMAAKPGALEIRARTAKGVKWALMTLRQLAQPKRGTLTVEGYEVPAFTLKDAPELSFRGLHVCAFPENGIPKIERMIRMAAYYKFNHVVLEQWGTFRSEKYPWYGWKDGYLTVAECRRLASVARDLGVTLIPQLNVFGHATAARSMAGKNAHLDRAPAYQPIFEPLAGWNWCLSNPHAKEVIAGLIDELHAAFGRPPFFHLGCDEATPPSCAACCASDYRALLAEHVRAAADQVEKLGARPMMWHDMLLKQGDPRWKGFYANGDDATSALVGTMTKKMVVCDWYYGSDPGGYKGKADSLVGKYPTLEYFTSAGYDTLTCPWKEPKGIAAQAGYAREHGLFGVLGTVWHFFQGDALVTIYGRTASHAWSRKAADAAKPEWYVFATHWRQVGWDTPGGDAYEEGGFYSNQVSPATTR